MGSPVYGRDIVTQRANVGVVTAPINVYGTPTFMHIARAVMQLKQGARVGILTPKPRDDKAVQIFLRVDGDITHRIGNAYL